MIIVYLKLKNAKLFNTIISKTMVHSISLQDIAYYNAQHDNQHLGCQKMLCTEPPYPSCLQLNVTYALQVSPRLVYITLKT